MILDKNIISGKSASLLPSPEVEPETERPLSHAVISVPCHEEPKPRVDRCKRGLQIIKVLLYVELIIVVAMLSVDYLARNYYTDERIPIDIGIDMKFSTSDVEYPATLPVKSMPNRVIDAPENKSNIMDAGNSSWITQFINELFGGSDNSTDTVVVLSFDLDLDADKNDTMTVETTATSHVSTTPTATYDTINNNTSTTPKPIYVGEPEGTTTPSTTVAPNEEDNTFWSHVMKYLPFL